LGKYILHPQKYALLRTPMVAVMN